LKDYTFIVNPEAGRGHGRQLIEPLRNELKARRIEYEILVTEAAGQALELTRNGAGPIVVAVGGDGTLNEVVNGFTARQRAIGIIPAGSGNDFIKSLNYPKRLPEALDRILSGKVQQVDAGVVTCTSSTPGGETIESRERIFVNGVGVGFDAAVAARMKSIRHLSGTAVYVLAVLQTLGKYKAPTFHITVDEVERASINLLIAIGNGRCAGGGFYLTPDAIVDDGELDLCVIGDVSVPKILRLMPLVMLGRHKNIREVAFLKAKKEILIRSDQKYYVHADGEVVGQGVNNVKINIRPLYLPILVG
jgi:YegS/Rv2252/BmrU family lipid kinase